MKLTQLVIWLKTNKVVRSIDNFALDIALLRSPKIMLDRIMVNRRKRSEFKTTIPTDGRIEIMKKVTSFIDFRSPKRTGTGIRNPISKIKATMNHIENFSVFLIEKGLNL